MAQRKLDVIQFQQDPLSSSKDFLNETPLKWGSSHRIPQRGTAATQLAGNSIARECANSSSHMLCAHVTELNVRGSLVGA